MDCEKEPQSLTELQYIAYAKIKISENKATKPEMFVPILVLYLIP